MAQRSPSATLKDSFTTLPSGEKMVAVAQLPSVRIWLERSSTTETKLPSLRAATSPPKRVIWLPGAAPEVRRPLAESWALLIAVWTRVAGSILKV